MLRCYVWQYCIDWHRTDRHQNCKYLSFLELDFWSTFIKMTHPISCKKVINCTANFHIAMISYHDLSILSDIIRHQPSNMCPFKIQIFRPNLTFPQTEPFHTHRHTLIRFTPALMMLFRLQLALEVTLSVWNSPLRPMKHFPSSALGEREQQILYGADLYWPPGLDVEKIRSVWAVGCEYYQSQRRGWGMWFCLWCVFVCVLTHTPTATHTHTHRGPVQFRRMWESVQILSYSYNAGGCSVNGSCRPVCLCLPDWITKLQVCKL